MLLQTLESVEIVLRCVARIASFDQLRIEGDDLFLGAAGFQSGLIGLGSLNLGLSTGSFGANVRIVELKQKLASFYAIAFFHQQALDGGWDRRVSLEIVDGFDFAIGRDQTADGAALDGCGAHFQRSLVKSGIKDDEDYDCA